MARWSLPLDRWAKATKGDMTKAARAASMEIFGRLLVKSPVDTGRFRGNWMIGVDVVVEAVTFEGGASGEENQGSNASAATAASMGRTDALARVRLGETIHFRNTLPYSVALERGHSNQAPQGVVRVTMLEAGALSRRALRKVRSRL